MKIILGTVAVILLGQSAYAQRAPCAALPGGCRPGQTGMRPGEVDSQRPGRGPAPVRPSEPPARPEPPRGEDRPGHGGGRPGGDNRPPVVRPPDNNGRPGNGFDRPGRPDHRPGHRPGWGNNRPSWPDHGIGHPGFGQPSFPVYPDPVIVEPVRPPVVEPMPIPSRPVVNRPVISQKDLDMKLYKIKSYEQDALYWQIQIAKMVAGTDEHRQAVSQLERVADEMLSALEEALIYSPSAKVESLITEIERKTLQYAMGTVVGDMYQQALSLLLQSLADSVQGDIYQNADFRLGELLARDLLNKSAQFVAGSRKSWAYVDAAEAAYSSALDLLRRQYPLMSYSEQINLREELRSKLYQSSLNSMARSFYNDALSITMD